MKKLILFACSIVTFTFTCAYSNAGGRSIGNGGGACVCRNDNHKIVKAKLIDLLEAEENGLTINNNNNLSDKEQLLNALLKLNNYPTQKELIKSEISKLIKNVKIIKGNVQLTPINDSTTYVCEKKYANIKNVTCKVEFLANYTNENVLLVSEEIYNSLSSNTDIAAFWTHEAYYSLDRKFHDANTSDNTKKFVGQLFAKNKSIDSSLIRNKFGDNDSSSVNVELFFRAVEDGNVQYVKKILDSGFYVDTYESNKYKLTALYFAIKNKNENMIDLLVSYGANEYSDRVQEITFAFGSISRFNRLLDSPRLNLEHVLSAWDLRTISEDRKKILLKRGIIKNELDLFTKEELIELMRLNFSRFKEYVLSKNLYSYLCEVLSVRADNTSLGILQKDGEFLKTLIMKDACVFDYKVVEDVHVKEFFFNYLIGKNRYIVFADNKDAYDELTKYLRLPDAYKLFLETRYDNTFFFETFLSKFNSKVLGITELLKQLLNDFSKERLEEFLSKKIEQDNSLIEGLLFANNKYDLSIKLYLGDDYSKIDEQVEKMCNLKTVFKLANFTENTSVAEALNKLTTDVINKEYMSNELAKNLPKIESNIQLLKNCGKHKLGFDHKIVYSDF